MFAASASPRRSKWIAPPISSPALSAQWIVPLPLQSRACVAGDTGTVGGSMLGLPGLRLPPAGFLLLLPFLLLLLPATPAPHRASYKPVIVVHGLFDSSYSFRHLLEYINETHPGTVVTVLDLFDGRESLRPLWEQVQGFREAVAPIMAKAPQGVHLICYSQGGLVCRALLSVMDDHNVDSFISLSSPQMGQYGDTDYLKWLFPTSMRSNLYRICYSPWGQEFSICNYWHDPHHDDLYLNASSFLALINGERDHPNATAWRKNFLRVGRLVLIGGPDDGVITPWQSSFFGFYDANETVLEMEEQLVYLRDSFGLKTLLARGAIVRCPMAGISHTAWHSNRTLYETCIEPWLS
ncbi:lysosomal thioesterase PPT2 isoform X2 [Lagenorhynchus albirostris]|uniref:Lysosomal thioesterase PPT2 n=1 Tax=Tursiops truncatus TaxID=9739 RepID=A0A6J3RZC8_TURTR|nr:lysosomal thioesterase PPT2 isoform X2 [Globicephala melas]XP_033719967.1 lysosomal thioesterase PPT2 isoform X3 [Tursiops truncatus]XP_060019133.1 lysosomal thioesterase PPT2 isoform X2 [Lagenorhynchus albirostris]